MEDNKGQFYSVKQVAERLNVSTRTVHRWIDDSRLPATKLGHNILRISQEDLDEFLDKHKTK